jgi:copper homeostasis protein (lipoprotein)
MADTGPRGFHPPVTYSGRIPCADCPGIDLTVTIFPDSTFRLRQTYQDRPAIFHDLGRWAVEENGTRLVLRGGTKAPRFFRLVGPDTLQVLDTAGQPIHSRLNYTLLRAPEVDPIRDTMPLRGHYTYMADAGRFTECFTGAAFPVAQTGANAALERAYGAAKAQPGAPLFVSVRGHFEEQAALEGSRRMEHVVVDSFDRVWPGATCEAPMPSALLENTYWKLIELGGRTVRLTEGGTELHLRLDPIQKQAVGSTGCNRFFSQYELNGISLRFGLFASTRRACLDAEMTQQENDFLTALGETRSWQITGDTLLLTGESGAGVRFAAQPMK